MTLLKTIIAWLLEDTSKRAPQPISQERMIYALLPNRADRMTAREWLGR